MSFLFNLPTDIVVCELFPFLKIADLSCLDVAITNRLLRTQLYFAFESLSIRQCWSGLTPLLLSWLLERSITLITATLSEDLKSQGLLDIFHLLVVNTTKASQIRHLDFSRCNASVTSNHIIKLVSCCSGLYSVNLSLCRQVTKSALIQLSKKCSHLSSLDLSITRVTDKALISLAANCSSLTSLNLRACSLVTNNAIVVLSKMCPGLSSLDLSLMGTRVIDDAVIALSLNCPALTKLNISSCCLTDVGLKALAQNCSSIESIDLSYSGGVTDVGVLELAQWCSTIRALSLNGNNKVTDASVVKLIEICPSLMSIELNFCTGISEEVRYFTYEKFPQL